MESISKFLLASIFKFLPQSDLLAAQQVCKKFHETIEEYELILNLVIHDGTDESSGRNRKYSKATVKSYKPAVHQKAFDSTGNYLKSLNFRHCTLNLNDIVTIINASPNVKYLAFDYVRLDDDVKVDVEKLPKLQNVSLQFKESDPNIFKALVRCSFEKVDLHFFGNIPYSNFADFVGLIKNQKKLSSFLVSGLYESNLFLIPMGKVEHQLKEISIVNCDFEEYDILESFLSQHAHTLEKFVLKDVRWDPSNFLNSCVRLKTLHVHRVELNSVGVLPSVEEGSFEPPLEKLSSFPNIKRLFLCRSAPVKNQEVSRSMPKLDELELKFGGVHGIEIPCLRKLTLTSLDGSTDPNFFGVHNKIEELVLLHVYHIDDALLKSIAINLVGLKVLRIIGDNFLTSQAFQIIKENCKSLKILEMAKWIQKFPKDDWYCLYDIKGLNVFVEHF